MISDVRVPGQGAGCVDRADLATAWARPIVANMPRFV